MKRTPRVTGYKPLMDVGYKYISGKITGFIASGLGS